MGAHGCSQVTACRASRLRGARGTARSRRNARSSKGSKTACGRWACLSLAAAQVQSGGHLEAARVRGYWRPGHGLYEKGGVPYVHQLLGR
jgi:hypothetical protein